MFCGICFPCCWLLTPSFLPNPLSSCSTLSARGIWTPSSQKRINPPQGDLSTYSARHHPPHELRSSQPEVGSVSTKQLHPFSSLSFIDSGILISILWFKTGKPNKKGNGISFSGKMPSSMCNVCMSFWWLSIKNNQEGYATAINVSPQGVRGRKMCEWSYQMDLWLSMC